MQQLTTDEQISKAVEKLRTNGVHPNLIVELANQIVHFTKVLHTCDDDAKISIENSLRECYVGLGNIANQYLSK